MTSPHGIAAAVWPFEGGPMELALAAGAAVLLVVAMAGILVALRRQRRRELRDLVSAVEELRSGRLSRRVEVDPRSPAILLADAVNRLAQDVAARWSELEGSAEELKGVLEAARDYGVVATDADGDVRHFSAGATALFGWDEDAVRGRSAAMLFDEDAWKEILPKLARRTLRERGFETRSVLLRRDGTRFHGRVSVRPLAAGKARAAGFLLIAQDVSEDVRLESELRASEERYRRLVEGLGEGVAIVRGGRVVYVNPAFAALAGVDPREAVGTALHDRIATGDVLFVRSRIERLEGAPEGTVDTFPAALAGPRGEPAARVRVTATSIAHEAIPSVLLVLGDETAERRALHELQANEARLDAVIESASDGLVVLDDTATGPVVRLTNEAFLRLTGLGRRQVLGATESDLVRHLRQRGGGLERIADRLGAPGRDAVTLTTSSVPPRAVELVLAAVPGGRVLACRDVTDQKAFEADLAANAERLRESRRELEASHAELRAVHEDLARHSGDLDRLNQELRTLDRMKSELLANVSHELQTPLVAVRGYTEMILKGRLGAITDEQHKGLSLSLRNIDRLIGLIDNLLAFARMEREGGPIHITTFPLGAAVDEAVELLRPKWEGRSIVVEVGLDDPAAKVRGDRDKILQVFINLLSNAVKYNRDGGRITVRVRSGKPGFLHVEVADSGVGIGQEDLEKIFDRHFQAASGGEARLEGSGIGLSIVRNILRLHGCVIAVASRLGEGTTFTFTLPEAPDKPLGEGSRHDDAPGKPPAPPAPGPPEPRERAEGLQSAAPRLRFAGRPQLRVIRRPGSH